MNNEVFQALKRIKESLHYAESLGFEKTNYNTEDMQALLTAFSNQGSVLLCVQDDLKDVKNYLELYTEGVDNQLVDMLDSTLSLIGDHV